MDDAQRERIFDRLEITASLSWLAMDFAWMEQSTFASVAFAIPTSLLSLTAIVFAERHATARCVAGAMAAWAIMNSFWMLRDLSLYDGLWLTRLAFATSVLLLCVALYAGGSSAALARELRRTFRRLRGSY